ncbi:MAG: DUF3108 domain-containing protein [Bacteroidia bacterium]
MKAFVIIISIILSIVLPAKVYAQASEIRTIDNKAFIRGEKLNYRVHYGFIDAGIASISIENENQVIGGRDTYHIVGTGTSTGACNIFFKVRDRYETFIDEKALCPLMFLRHVDEGGFRFNQDQVYDQEYHKVNSNGKVYTVPSYVQDMLSAFYYARTFDYSNEKPGKIDSVIAFVDDTVWTLRIKFIKRDTLDSDIGKIRCMVFEPLVQKGRIFKHNNDLQVWISDDVNHVPIRAQANILVGSVKLDLESYSGLATDLSLVK